MSNLHVHTVGNGSTSTDSDDNVVAISHLATRKIGFDAERIIDPSPGIVILMPHGASATVICDTGSIDLPPGSALLTRGNTVRHVEPPPVKDGEIVEECVLHVIELNAIVNRTVFIAEQIGAPTVLRFGEASVIDHVFNQLSMGSSSRAMFQRVSDMEVCLYGAQLVALLLEISKQNIRSDTDPRLATFQQFCRHNLAGRITTTDMAKTVGMSRAGFNQWVTPLIGTSPARYLREMRLEHSQVLLINTDQSLEQITEDCGFSSRYHMSREFKKLFGVTPAKYRTARRFQTGERAIVDANRLVQVQNYAGALDLYNQVLKRGYEPETTHKIRFQKAVCLHELGQTDRACAIWRSLRPTPSGIQSNVRLCRHMVDDGDFDAARAHFISNFDGRKSQGPNPLIDMWMDIVNGIIERRDALELQRWIALRRSHFPTDSNCSMVMFRALTQLGHYHLVGQDCPNLLTERISALRGMGEYQTIFDLFEKSAPPDSLASARTLAGMYEEILERHPKSLAACTRALTALGRPEEAIRRYPKNCEDALLALERYDEIIAGFPENLMHQIFARHALGRLSELDTAFTKGTYHWGTLKLYHDPQALIQGELDPGYEFYHSGQFLVAIQALVEDDTDRGTDMLREIPPAIPEGIWYRSFAPEILLLAPIARGMLGETEYMTEQFDCLTTHYPNIGRQRVRHDIHFIMGDLNEVGYRSQPTQLSIDKRFDFIDAVRHDLQKQCDDAITTYRHFLETTRPYEMDQLTRHRFAEWRLKALQ